jgi:hypothetical protein
MQHIADEAMALIAGVDGVLVGFVRDRGWLTFECVAGASLGGVNADRKGECARRPKTGAL